MSKKQKLFVKEFMFSDDISSVLEELQKDVNSWLYENKKIYVAEISVEKYSLLTRNSVEVIVSYFEKKKEGFISKAEIRLSKIKVNSFIEPFIKSNLIKLEILSNNRIIEVIEF